jgi:hypothetical protein
MVIHLTNWPWLTPRALMVTVIERHRHHGAVPDLDRGGDFPRALIFAINQSCKSAGPAAPRAKSCLLAPRLSTKQ